MKIVVLVKEVPDTYGDRKLNLETGLAEIRDLAQWALDRGQGVPFDGPAGSVTEREMLREYAEFLRGLVDLSGGRPLKVVVDAGNGMGGHTVPAVLGEPAASYPAVSRTTSQRPGRGSPIRRPDRSPPPKFTATASTSSPERSSRPNRTKVKVLPVLSSASSHSNPAGVLSSAHIAGESA